MDTAVPGKICRAFNFLRKLIIGCALITLSPVQAHAYHFYWEFGGGMSQIDGSAAFFGHDDALSLGYGGAFNLALAAGLTAPKSPIPVHLGIQHRISTGVGGGTSYALQAMYPLLRIHLSRLYVGVGATPLVWDRMSFSSRKRGGYAAMADGGLELPITHEISFNLMCAAQTVFISGGMSPEKIWEVGAGFRLYYGNFKRSSSSLSSDDPGPFEGFRYPFGREKKR